MVCHAVPEFKLVSLGSRQFREVWLDLTGCQSQEEAGDRLLEQLPALYKHTPANLAASANPLVVSAEPERAWTDHLYKINLIGTTDVDFRLNLPIILARLKEKLFYVKLIDQTHQKINLTLLAREHSLKGAFVRCWLQKHLTIPADITRGKPSQQTEPGDRMPWPDDLDHWLAGQNCEDLWLGLQAFDSEVDI